MLALCEQDTHSLVRRVACVLAASRDVALPSWWVRALADHLSGDTPGIFHHRHITTHGPEYTVCTAGRAIRAWSGAHVTLCRVSMARPSIPLSRGKCRPFGASGAPARSL